MIKYRVPLTQDERDRLLQALEIDIRNLAADHAVFFTLLIEIAARVLKEDPQELWDKHLAAKKELINLSSSDEPDPH